MTITAKIIADSISRDVKQRITTFELEYPRFIHAELMTHRLFSRNAASSRAIPVNRCIELIRDNPAMPSHWGKNQPGMSAKEECDAPVKTYSLKDSGYGENRQSKEDAWISCRNHAIHFAQGFSEAGYHKQIVNRILEPYSHIKVVVTATSFDNFFNLRCHPDAQPEIKILADEMWKCYNTTAMAVLSEGDWHVPYYGGGFWCTGDNTPLEDAIAISASCCAQVSYRRLDDSIEKARMIYSRLIESKPAHASPMEHQATPITKSSAWYTGLTNNWSHVDGVTGVRFDKSLGGMPKCIPVSGNFSYWIQNRQLLQDHDCWDYE